MSDTIRHALIDEHSDLANSLLLFDEATQYKLARQQQPAVAIGIVYKGDLLWAKAYGLADQESARPATLDTRFRIASISKTFTAVSILQLWEAGKLRLDDPVADHLDWFTVRYNDDAPAITIRHLLTHTSGLPRDGARAIWEEDNFHTWDEVVELMPQRVPTMAPMQQFSYSNLGYTLLGAIIAQVSGLTWNAYVQQHILDPLQMSDTLTAAKGGEPALATGYLRPDAETRRGAVGVVDAKAFDSATGMASTVRDLAKYARFHLGHSSQNSILSEHALREMHRVHVLLDNWEAGYGLGSSLYRIDGHQICGHSGGYKGYLTNLSLDRKRQVATIVLTNAIDSNPQQYVELLFKSVVPDVAKIAPEKHEAQDDWQQYVGRYESDWVNGFVLVHSGQLLFRNVAFPLAPATVLQPTDEAHVFRMEQIGSPGDKARFEFDTSGEVVRLWLANEYALRVR